METKKPFEDIAKLRKAIAPLLQELIPDGNLTVMAMSKEDYRSFMVSMRNDIALIAKSIETMGEAILDSRPPEKIIASIDFSKVDNAITRLVSATDNNSLRLGNLEKNRLRVEGLEELRTILAKTLQNLVTLNKKPTNPNDPTDYVNVRLTDGQEFYNAIRRAIASVTEGIAAYKDVNGNTVQVQLTAGGQVPVSFANTVLSTSGTVTSASGTLNAHIDNYPTVQTVVVQSMPGITVSPTVSGSQNWVNVPFPNTTTVTQGTSPWTTSGTFSNVPGNTIAVSGTVTSASGTLNAHVDNFPTVQTVQVIGSVSTTPGVTTSGTNWSHIDNYPTTQTVISTSGSVHSAIDNFPSVQTTQAVGITSISGTISNFVSYPELSTNKPGVGTAILGRYLAAPAGNLTDGQMSMPLMDNFGQIKVVPVGTVSVQMTASGVNNVNVDNFPSVQTTIATGITSISGTIANSPGNTLATSGTINGNVTTISTSGTQHAVVDNFPTTTTVTSVSGSLHAVVDNFPTTFTISNETPSAITVASGTSNINIGNYPTTQSVVSVSGSFHSVIDNFPNTTTVTQGNVPWTVSGTISNTPGQPIAVSGTINGVVAASGVNNVHVDNYPTVQTVQVIGNVSTTPGTTASGTNFSHIDNFPTVQTVQFNPSQLVNIGTMPNVTSASGTFNAHVDNYPTTQTVVQGTSPWTVSGTFSNVPGNTIATSGTINGTVTTVSISGTQHAIVDNFPTTQSVISVSGSQHAVVDNFPTILSTQAVGTTTISGSNPLPTSDFGWNYRNLKTAVGIANTTGMTLLVSGVANRVTKVYAFSVVTPSSTAVTADFRGTDATLLWQTPLQAIAATNFGSNATVTPPAYIFKSSPGAGISANLSAAQAVTYNIAYWQDDSS
ncbi:MAG TPA: hypothetical protein VNX65_02380 [Patescibacteria group bacterium]|jgi:hypothetical protein|nr:hypothetical protein [Patescibacteria group bacterium]